LRALNFSLLQSRLLTANVGAASSLRSRSYFGGVGFTIMDFSNDLKAGYGARRRPLDNEVSPLWEWLPATIIAVRRGGLPQVKKPTSLEGRWSKTGV
jgi:hypothetical protein